MRLVLSAIILIAALFLLVWCSDDNVKYTYRIQLDQQEVSKIELSINETISGYDQRDGRSAGVDWILTDKSCAGAHECQIFFSHRQVDAAEPYYAVSFYGYNPGGAVLEKLHQKLYGNLAGIVGQDRIEIDTESAGSRDLDFIRSEF
ncbi:hypothetical protein [Pseudemcibacter aquimaris]|uniref:hypothetical protein n=1 Tax=Pseudemcibacter aquimaris TaxID=2857064 RepID=UPI002011FA0B|nr:hypothetical protein [Pseudemcibacter aquimaris]MCC3861409.1 hypothetical protein [Pseudemcibacter aquimaris]WDU58179.1 hypothetical protein KW060_13375 [Pseudemcibacter aquimaris]